MIDHASLDRFRTRSPLDGLRDVFATLNELEWIRTRGGGEPPEPPFISWRFKQARTDIEDRIAVVLRDYRGNVEWRIEKPGRNWVIVPERFAIYADAFRVDHDALQAFALEFPEESGAANEDALRLVEHLRQQLLGG